MMMGFLSLDSLEFSERGKMFPNLVFNPEKVALSRF